MRGLYLPQHLCCLRRIYLEFVWNVALLKEYRVFGCVRSNKFVKKKGIKKMNRPVYPIRDYALTYLMAIEYLLE